MVLESAGAGLVVRSPLGGEDASHFSFRDAARDINYHADSRSALIYVDGDESRVIKYVMQSDITRAPCSIEQKITRLSGVFFTVPSEENPSHIKLVFTVSVNQDL